MPKPIVAANWKMNLLRDQAHELALGVGMLADRWPQIEIALFPGFLTLSEIARGTKDGPITIGAQDCHYEESGAFTGEVSPRQLRDIGANAVILGHSERRSQHGEDNEILNKKLVAARAAGLKVIFCVGENLEEREAGKAEDVVKDALSALHGLDAHDRERIDIAYEPVWAIGTGKIPEAEDVGAMHTMISKSLLDLGGFEEARILYGGSVKPDNAASLIEIDQVNGFLVGGASLELGSFVGIIDAVAAKNPSKKDTN